MKYRVILLVAALLAAMGYLAFSDGESSTELRNFLRALPRALF